LQDWREIATKSNFIEFFRNIMSPDSGECFLKVKEDRIQARIRENGFVNLRLKVNKGLGGVTVLTKPILEGREQVIWELERTDSLIWDWKSRRVWVVLRPLRNPYWKGESTLFDSRYQWSLLFRIFWNNFPRTLVRAIGRCMKLLERGPSLVSRSGGWKEKT